MPELEGPLALDRMRRAWPEIAGREVARHARPWRLVNGCLEIVADNSPWLHELTLRAPELSARLSARFSDVRSLRVSLGPLPATVAPPTARPPRRRALSRDEAQEIDTAVATIGDEQARSAARRLLVRARQASMGGLLAVLTLAGALPACATMGQLATQFERATPRQAAAQPLTPAAEAYYHYSIAQLHAQAGRFKEAVAAIQEAIRRDERSAFLWRELAHWLARIEEPEQALAAARKAVEIAPDDPAGHLTLAELHRGQRRYVEAEAELERVIALNPEAQEPYLTLARYHVERKAYDRAREVLQRLIERHPRLAQAHFLLGRLAIETDQLDEAITRLSRAVELDPDHDGAWTALGYAYEAKRQPDEAVAAYRHAVQSNPDNPTFVERLGDLLIRLGRFAEAQSEIESLTEVAPRDARLWTKLGAVYYEQKLWDKAADAFRRAVLLESNNLRARYFLAASLMEGGHDDDARIELERILRLDPRSIDARVQLGFLHGRAKRYDEAIAVLREAVNLEPKRPELFLYLGSAYFRDKQYDRAAEILQEGLIIDDKSKDLHFQLGVVLEKQQRFKEAVGAFRRVIALDPKHAEAYNYVGYMYAERGENLDEAVELITKALDLEPDNGYFIDSLGWAYYQQGRYPEALRELERAVQKAKEPDPVIFDHLGDAYVKAGRNDDALAAWERSLQLDPTAAGIKKKVDELRQRLGRLKGEPSKATP
jgi:tetratricopeptide (TPR) repeat protein